MFNAISPGLRQQIAAIAHESAPNECCGFVVTLPDGAQTIVRSRNVASDPTSDFKTSPSAWRKAARAGTIAAIYHSHCRDDQPTSLTYADIAGSKKHEIPYYLIHTEYDGAEDYYDPDSLHPFPMRDNGHTPNNIEFYLGRSYQWWRSDCYTILRDYYRGRLGIELQDFTRSPNEDEWMVNGWNRYVDDLSTIGFHQVDDRPKNNDLILMTLEGQNPHHIGIMVDADRSQFIHHLRHRLSERSVYGGFWQERTHSVWRHVNFS